MAEYDDLASLSSIDPGMVMDTLQQRHKVDKIYTKNGAVLVAINPYKSMTLYEDQQLKQYKESMALETEPPHIFAVAAATHRALISEGKDQSVVISGESGAGKTESARFVLQYLRYVSNATEDLERRIHTSQPLTEAFGCAKTVRNDNRCVPLTVDLDLCCRTARFLTLCSAASQPRGADVPPGPVAASSRSLSDSFLPPLLTTLSLCASAARALASSSNSTSTSPPRFAGRPSPLTCWRSRA